MKSFRFYIIALGMSVLAACASNPFKTAQNIEQKADAAYGSFVIAQEGAVSVVRDPATPQAVKDALKQADALAKPLADALQDAAIDYKGVKAAYDGASADAGQLKAAEDKLAAALAKALKSIEDYVVLVSKVRKPVAALPRSLDLVPA